MIVLAQLLLFLGSPLPIMLRAVWVTRMVNRKLSLREILLFVAYCALALGFYSQFVPWLIAYLEKPHPAASSLRVGQG